MKRLKRLFVPLILMLTTVSCSEKIYPDPTQFIIGSWYGFCHENCIHIYKLENGKLYADDMSTRNQSEQITFQKTALEETLVEEAKRLYELFPSYFRKNPNLTIGCPDCHDQGLLYVALKENGELLEWKIDPDINNHPPEIKPFMIAMKELLKDMPK